MNILKKLYIDPFMVALLGAVALGVLIPISGQAAEILGWITKLAIALLFFLYGARLSTTEVWSGLRSWRLQATAVALTFVLYPAVGLAMSAVFGRFLPADVAAGIVFLAVVSATVQTCISQASIAGGNAGAAVVAASMSSMVGVFVTPLLVAALLGASGAARVDLSAFISIVTQLLLPFVVGQLVHKRIGGFLKRHQKVLRRTDRSFVLLVVFSAFSAGTAAGIWGSVPPASFVIVVALCAALLAIALLASVTIGRLLGLAREDRVVLVFVGTSKSVAAGLPIAGVLFAGDSLALIILPLMFYHQVQLFACTVIAQRLGSRAPEEVGEQSAPSVPSPAYEELLHRLEQQSGGNGIARIADGVAERARTANGNEAADVTSADRPDDPRIRRYVATRMGVFVAGNVGALVVEADARSALERFAARRRTFADKQQLIQELQSAGMLDWTADCDEAFDALLAAVGDHPIRVLVFDNAEHVRDRLQAANPYVAAVVSGMLTKLAPGQKVIALVGAFRTNSVGDVDDYLDRIPIDLRPGDAIYYRPHVASVAAVVLDATTFGHEPHLEPQLARL